MALHPDIQAVIDNEAQVRPALANNHLKSVITEIENHPEIITPANFRIIMDEVAAELKLETSDRIKDLKTVFKLRDKVSAAIQKGAGNAAGVAPAEVPVEKPAPKTEPKAVEAEIVEPTPAPAPTPAPVSNGLGALAGLVDDVKPTGVATPASNPELEDDGDVIETTAETVTKVPTETLITTGKDPVLKRAPVAEAGGDEAVTLPTGSTIVAEVSSDPTAPPPAETVTEPAPGGKVDPATLVEMPAEDAPAGGLTALASGTKGKGGKGGKATPVSDLDAALNAALDKIEAQQKLIEQLQAENAKLKEQAVPKVSQATLSRLQKLGLTGSGS